MYVVAAGIRRVIYVEFHARRTYILIGLNGTEHMHIVTARLHMMIYM
jgi:hypothetical protein